MVSRLRDGSKPLERKSSSNGFQQTLVEMLFSNGVKDVDISKRRRAEYSSDASNYRIVPSAVVYPGSGDEVLGAIDVANETGLSITMRGGGTSVAGNSIGSGIVLDTTRYMNKVIDIDPEAKTATVQPGLILDELASFLSPIGLLFGPDPSTHSRASIGGMIGNNSCGAHSIAYGKTQDNVASLKVVDGRGRVFQAKDDLEVVPGLSKLIADHEGLISAQLGRFPRQVSGYSLQDLLSGHPGRLARSLVGSEGTTVGVIESTLKLIEAPKVVVLAILGYSDMITAAYAAPAIAAMAPQTIEGFDSRLLERLRSGPKRVGVSATLPKGKGWLFVECAGETLSEALASAKAVTLTSGVIDSIVVRDTTAMRMLWRLRDDGAGLAGRTIAGKAAWPGFEDAAVPPFRLGDYLVDFQDLLGEFGFDGLIYGHFGEGCIHSRIDFDLESDPQRFRAFMESASDLVVSYDGSLSGEHGDGRARSQLLTKMYSPQMISLFAEFKGLFDPNHVMNKGVLVEPAAFDDSLRLEGVREFPRRKGFGFSLDGGDFGAGVHRCVGVGKCRLAQGANDSVMCPSYVATLDEKDSTRGRARVLQEMLNGTFVKGGWRSKEVHEALDLCLSCKACSRDCPAGVDMARYKAEVLFNAYNHRMRPMNHYLLGRLSFWAELGGAFPNLANKVLTNDFAKLAMEKVAGIDRRRTLPPFAKRSFVSTLKGNSVSGSALGRGVPQEGGLDDERLGPKSLSGASSKGSMSRVVLMVDPFNNHFSPWVLEDCLELLRTLEIEVVVAPKELSMAITEISTGQLEIARRKLRRLVEWLFPLTSSGYLVLVLEPSCAGVLRSDLVELHKGEGAKSVCDATVTLAELLMRVANSPRSSWQPPNLRGETLIWQPHCHQYADIGVHDDLQLLKATGANLLTVTGCCGMAGNFGMELSHYDLSVRVAQRSIISQINEAPSDAVVVADGFSCRSQVSDLTDKVPLHLGSIMLRGLK